MIVRLDRVADLSEEDRGEIRAVSQAVYPPGDPGAGPSQLIEWARPDWCVRVHAGGQLVSCAGALTREGTCEGRPVRIGGIGGVMTHPDARRKGYAEAGVQRAIAFLRESDVDFALLVCRPHLLEYYGRQGWRPFDGELVVRQQGERAVFDFNRGMTFGVRAPAPTTGAIDLCGLPW